MNQQFEPRKTECRSPDDQALDLAAEYLAAGRLVAFATETVYGLGADARNANAVADIFAAKGRPAFNPLISHVATSQAAFGLGRTGTAANALAEAFWPGPMTLVLWRGAHCPIAMLTSSGLERIAIRVPAHGVAADLLGRFGHPVAAPSANPSGKLSPTSAAHVMHHMNGRVDLVIDAGVCEGGIESTIVDCTGERAAILRPGGITRARIADCLSSAGQELAPSRAPAGGSDSPVAPGQLESHYAPRAPLRINQSPGQARMELIGFAGVDGQGELAMILSPSGDLREAAANLFEMLHMADALVGSPGSDTKVIGVAPVPNEGLGEAMNDRLKRAAFGATQ